MLEEILARIEERLAAVGLSASAASKRAGLTEDAIRNIKRAVETGSRKGVSTQTLSALARVLQTTEGWLLTGTGEVDTKPSGMAVPIAGRVGAGAVVEAIADPNPRYVTLPIAWDDATAFEVVGDSCYPVFEAGDFIVVRGDQRLSRDEIEGQMCVVETEDGLGLVKKVYDDGQGTFQLDSPNAQPLKRVRLRSARPVLARIARGGLV